MAMYILLFGLTIVTLAMYIFMENRKVDINSNTEVPKSYQGM